MQAIAMHLREYGCQLSRQSAHTLGFVEWRPQVQGHGTARREDAFAMREERLRVERTRERLRVGEIEQDQIEFLRGSCDEGGAILVVHLYPRVVERAVVNVPKMASRHFNNLGVDLHQRHFLHAGVFEQFFHGATVAAADDERPARRGMRDRRRMHQRLMVEEFVGLRGHEAAVNAQGAAKLI